MCSQRLLNTWLLFNCPVYFFFLLLQILAIIGFEKKSGSDLCLNNPIGKFKAFRGSTSRKSWRTQERNQLKHKQIFLWVIHKLESSWTITLLYNCWIMWISWNIFTIYLCCPQVSRYAPLQVSDFSFFYLCLVKFFDRLTLFGMPAKHQPDFVYLRHVPLRKVHLFTIIQLSCLILLWVIKTSRAAIVFPMMVISQIDPFIPLH